MDKMDSVAIDPELFMLCRLCTDEKGMFQIVPKVQIQFKECFDITVEQFDGLSQLVCEKCKDTLNDFNTMKKKFQEKQKLLHDRVHQNIAKEAVLHPEQTQSSVQSGTQPQAVLPAEENIVENLPIENNTVSSTKSDEQPVVTKSYAKSKPKSKKSHKKKFSLKIKLGNNGTKDNWHISNSGSKTTQHCAESEAKAKKLRHKIEFEKLCLDDNYVKKFNCRLCTRSAFKRSDITKHVKIHHNLLSIKKNLIAKECFLNLKRLDDKMNFTGDHFVAFHPSRLAENSFQYDNSFITYVSKTSLLDTNVNSAIENTMECLSDASTVDLNSMQRNNSESMDVCDISDKSCSEDENFLRKSRRLKRTLLLSSSESEFDAADDLPITSGLAASSEDQIVKCHDPLDLLKENTSSEVNKPGPKKNEAVNLNHSKRLFGTTLKPNSSNDESVKKNGIENNITKFNEFKPIRDIINMAYYKMNRLKNKEHRSTFRNDVDLLNKKLLSIGRKVMSKSGYTSLALLKYLAKRNLHIAWTDHLRCETKSSKDGNMVRIMTRTMMDDTDNLHGFSKVTCTEDSASSDITSSECLLRIGSGKHLEEQVTDGQVKTILESLLVNKLVNIENVEKDLGSVDNSILEIHKSNEEDRAVNGNEAAGTLLLNKSPVSNPKPPFRKKFNDGKPEEASVDAEQSASLLKCVNFNGDAKSESTTSVYVVSSEDETMIQNANQMPIIASTTSLAMTQYLPSRPESSILKRSKESLVPRIKCKNVIDLMPDKVFHRSNCFPRHDISNAARIQTVVNNFLPMGGTALVSSPSAIMSSEGKRHKKDSPMMFHTMLLPNTPTHSPFGYFKALLGLHTMKLVKPAEGKSSMCSLVKFTLVVQQHPIATEMCLDLMVHMTEFCIRITNHNTIVNIKEMAAAWQWEVLKAFRAEKVYTRAIEYAEKINSKTCYNTKLFFNILNSIQDKTIGSV